MGVIALEVVRRSLNLLLSACSAAARVAPH
jgi:hypothetical protein